MTSSPAFFRGAPNLQMVLLACLALCGRGVGDTWFLQCLGKWSRCLRGGLASYYNQQWGGHRNVRSEALRQLLLDKQT